MKPRVREARGLPQAAQLGSSKTRVPAGVHLSRASATLNCVSGPQRGLTQYA